jgi:hypothetical protein
MENTLVIVSIIGGIIGTITGSSARCQAPFLASVIGAHGVRHEPIRYFV